MSEHLTLHLLRHGAPLKEGLLLGHQDMPSTPEGEAQILAQVAELKFDRILSSDLSRCAAPAQKIAVVRELPLTLDARWRELDFGLWDGLHPSEIDTERMGRFWQDPEANAPPQGEQLSALTGRVGAALSELAGGSALIVTHGGTMRAALHLLLGLAHPSCWSIALPYAARCTLGLWRDETSGAGWSGQLEALQP